MKVVMNVKKSYFFAIVGLLILFAGMFAVNAFGGVDPSVMGHSAGEVDLSDYYTRAEVDAKFDALGGDTTASTSDYLVNLQHTEDQCTALGGVVVSGMCQFNSASCPSGWAQYGQWSTTVYNDNNDDNYVANDGVCSVYTSQWETTADSYTFCMGVGTKQCTYSKHSWSSNAVDSCSVSYSTNNCVASTLTCTAKRTQIGCY